jgi:hypothetical protein
VGAETSLEVIPGDGVDVCMGVAVRLPPVGCCPIELVRSKKDLPVISALGNMFKETCLVDPRRTAGTPRKLGLEGPRTTVPVQRYLP